MQYVAQPFFGCVGFQAQQASARTRHALEGLCHLVERWGAVRLVHWAEKALVELDHIGSARLFDLAAEPGLDVGA